MKSTFTHCKAKHIICVISLIMISVLFNIGIIKAGSFSIINSSGIIPINLSADKTDICNGDAVTITATGGSYYYMNGFYFNSQVTLFPNSTTTFTVTGYDNMGNTGTAEITITVRGANFEMIVNGQSQGQNHNISICPNSTLTIKDNNIQSGYTYQWNTGDTTSSITVNPTISQSYQVTVTGNGCTTHDNFWVNVIGGITIYNSQPNTICPGSSIGLWANCNYSPNYNYIWNTGDKEQGIYVTPTASTTYTVTITDQTTGCSASENQVVIFSDTINTNISSDQVICNGTSTSISAWTNGGGSNYTYQWSMVNGQWSMTGQNVTVSPNQTTTYIVTVTGSPTCSGTAQTVVTVSDHLIPQVSPDMAVCAGNSVGFGVIGGSWSNTYSWSASTGSLNGMTGQWLNVTPTQTTTYTLTVTGTPTCSGTAQVVIKLNSVDINASVKGMSQYPNKNIILCGTGTITLSDTNYTSGNRYLWNTGDTTSSIIISPTFNQTYFVTMTSNGCTSTDAISVNVLPVASTINLPQNITICHDNASPVNFCASANNPNNQNFNWQASGGLYYGNTSCLSVSPTQTTTYTVTMSEPNGCTSTGSVTVTISDTLKVGINPDQTICPGSTAWLSAWGGNTYQWSMVNGQWSMMGQNVSVNPTETSTYTVTVSNSPTCSGTAQIVINVSNSLTPYVIPDTMICKGSSISLFANGGYNTQWSTIDNQWTASGTSVTVIPSQTTTYTVTISNSPDCSGTGQVIVNVIGVNLGWYSNNVINVCKGTPGYSLFDYDSLNVKKYLWSTGDTTSSIIFNTNASQIYTVTSTAKGCISTDQVSVNVLDMAKIYPQQNIKTCPDNTFPVSACIDVFPWRNQNLRWSTGDYNTTCINVQPTQTTVYKVTMWETNGCQAVDSVIVQTSYELTPWVSQEQIICPGSTAYIYSGGGSNYSWSASTGSVTGLASQWLNVTPTQTTTYTVTVSNSSQCSGTGQVIITVADTLTPKLISIKDTICAGEQISLMVDGSYKYYNVNYCWNDGESSNGMINVKPSHTTTYIVTVWGETCFGTAQKVIYVRGAYLGRQKSLTACGITSFDLKDYNRDTTTTGENYFWNTGQTTPDITVAPESTQDYILKVTGNGCITYDTVHINVTPIAPVVSLGNDTFVCKGNSNITLTANINNKWENQVYYWSSGYGYIRVNNISVRPTHTTTYGVTTTDSNGCTASDEIVVTVNGAILNNKGIWGETEFTLACKSNPATLLEDINVHPGETFLWSTGDTTPSITVYPTTDQHYYLTVTGNGCTTVDMAEVKMLYVDLGHDTTDCNNNYISTNLCAKHEYGLFFCDQTTYCYWWNNLLWSTGKTTYYADNCINVNPSQTTTYTVTATGRGCIETAQKIIYLKPVVSAGADQTICNGSSATLSAQGATKYEWSTVKGQQLTGQSITVSPTENTIYTVTGTDANGCSSTSSVTVTVNPLPIISAGEDATICPDNSISFSASGADRYIWNTGDTTAAITVQPSISTKYIVKGYRNGCSGTDDITIYVDTLCQATTPHVDFNFERNINASLPNITFNFYNISNNLPNDAKYDWNFGDCNSNSLCTQQAVIYDSIIHNYLNPGIYNVALSVKEKNKYLSKNKALDGNNYCVPEIRLYCFICGTWQKIDLPSGTSGRNSTYNILPNTKFYLQGDYWDGNNSYNYPCTDNRWYNNGNGNNAKITVKGTKLDITNPNSKLNSIPLKLDSGKVIYEFSSYPDQNITPGYEEIATITINVSANSTIPTGVYAGPDQTICMGTKINLRATGGNGIYRWNTGASGPTIIPNANVSKKYIVSSTISYVTDSISATCPVSDTVNVTVQPNVYAGPDQTICGSGSVTLSAQNCASYKWSNNIYTANQAVTPTVTTKYSVTGTLPGCTSTDDLTIVVDPILKINSINYDDTIVCNNSPVEVTVSINPNGSTPPWNYQVSQNGGQLISGTTNSTTFKITVNPVNNTSDTITATFNLGVNNHNNCGQQKSFKIIIKPNSVDAGPGKTICSGTSTTLTATGCGTFSWSNGKTSQTINVSPVSTTVYVVSSINNGVTMTDNVVVTVNQLPTASAGSDRIICLGNTTKLTATGGTAYSWNKGSTNQSIDVSPIVQTTYIVTVINNNCTSTADVIISIDNPKVDAGKDTSVVIGEKLKLKATALLGTAPYTYTWNTIPNKYTDTIIVKPTGNVTIYKVTMKDNIGCQTSDSVIVYTKCIIGNIKVNNDTFCKGEKVILSASGGLTYLWNTGDTAKSITKYPSNTTTYIVTITKDNCSIVLSKVITVKSLPLVNAGADQTVCPGLSATLTATGGTTYSWLTVNGQRLMGQSITVSPTKTTSYYVTATGINGCSAKDTVVVTFHNLTIKDSILTPGTFFCSGQKVVLQTTADGASVINGSYYYKWSTGSMNRSIWVYPKETTTYTTTTKYIVPGTTKECLASTSIVVKVINIAVDAGKDIGICINSSATLTATATPTGGESYTWSSGDATKKAIIQPKANTTYVVTATKSGCTTSDAVIVYVNDPTVDAGPDQIISNCENATLTATLTASNQLRPTYKWSTKDTTSKISVWPQVTTTYKVTTTVWKNSCSATDQVVVTVNKLGSANAGPDQTICSGDSATLIATGGIYYRWSNGSRNVTNRVYPAKTTTYKVTITISAQCTATDEVVVTVNTTPTANAGKDQTICNGSSVTLTATGGGTYQWTIDNGQLIMAQSVKVNPTVTTTYVVTVTNINGCWAKDSVVVKVIPITANAGQDRTICAGDSTTLTALGGGTYLWNTGVSTSTINVKPTISTTYTVTVKNLGCSATDQVVVYYGGIPLATTTDKSCSLKQTYVVQSPVPGATYSWSISSTSGKISCNNCTTDTVSWNYISSGVVSIIIYADYGNGCKSSNTIYYYPCCSINNSDSTLDNANIDKNKNLPNNSKWYFNGTINVVSNKTLKGLDIALQGGSKIIVKSGVTLTLDTCYLHACSDYVWDGIYLEPNSYLRVIHGSTISEAYNAVVSKDNGGTYQIDGSNLLNNYYGIKIINYATGSKYPGFIKNSNINIILGSMLIRNPPYPISEYSGIYVENINLLKINEVNIFNNVLWSIYAINSNIDIRNQNFNNRTYGIHAISDYPNYKNAFIKSNIFNKVEEGIYTMNYLDTISSNIINFTDWGIWSENFSKMSKGTMISKNKITYSRKNPNDAQIGIYFNSNSYSPDFTIENNVINNTAQGIYINNLLPTIGIARIIKNNKITYSEVNTKNNNEIFGVIIVNNNGVEITSDTISNLTNNYSHFTGIYTDSRNTYIHDNTINGNGYDVGISGISDLGNSIFSCNLLNNCNPGFEFDHNYLIQGANTTYLGDQQDKKGNGGNGPTCNEWVNPAGSNNARISATAEMHPSSSNSALTKWYYTGNADKSNNFSPQNSALDNYLFFEFHSKTSGNCNCSSKGGVGGKCNEDDDYREKNIGSIVRGQMYYGKLQNSMSYISKQFAYNILKGNKKLLKVGNDNDPIYQQFYNDQLNTNIGKFARVSNLIDSGRVAEARRLNISIVDTNLLETNQKTVNDIFLNSLALNKKPDSIQKITLTNIAYQKPYLGGNGVYMARVILGIFVDDRIKNVPQNKSLDVAENYKSENDYKVYPNPAKDEINVIFDGELIDGVLEIYSIIGDLKQSINLKGKPKITNISISSLESGVYLYRITRNNQIVLKDKLVIIK